MTRDGKDVPLCNYKRKTLTKVHPSRKLNHNIRWPDITDTADCFQKARFCQNINPGSPQFWIASSMAEGAGVGSIQLSEME